MVRQDPSEPDAPDGAPPARRRKRRPRLRAALARVLAGAVALVLGVVLILSVVPLPATPYMLAERWRLGGLAHEWVALERVAPEMARAAVAAEDANFCLHWGFDMEAIRAAIDDGRGRGASTISQQTVKNVFLWQGRSWARKALEAGLTPLVEALWTKRRILEVYLNVAEFGEGVFGVQAAARHHFGVDAADLSAVQAARLAAILPDPKDRDPARPTAFLRGRAAAILDGAGTIAADGRARCFEQAAG
ncbi:MAG: monofunctional biosynthetic peptidoglycan transglycosylase [Gemmobacter sp.]